MSFNTPVLLIIWRRPHTTQQVINAIRAVNPPGCLSLVMGLTQAALRKRLR
jgi:hypothetical protein